MCDAADEASDGVRSQLSRDLADVDDDDDDDGAASCYSSADNESLNGAPSHADDPRSQLPSPHQTNSAAAVAAAALISDQYSVETLLANVQALLKLAMDSARHREQQARIKAGQSTTNFISVVEMIKVIIIIMKTSKAPLTGAPRRRAYT